MLRRSLLAGLTGAAALAALAALTGCGFRLRRPAELPFGSLALVGFKKQSATEATFRRELTGAVDLPESRDRADVVLTALRDDRERSVVASTAAGQVREIQLRLIFAARADTPAGRALMAPVELRLTRDLSYSETAALAKAEEEAALFREMEVDVVGQILRRLAAIPR